MPLGIPSPSDALTWAGSIAAGSVTLAFAVQKILRIWAQGNTDLNSHQGENQVVTLLRTELDRVSHHNKDLDAKIIELISVVEDLRKQNLVLQSTIQSMVKELAVYRSQQKPAEGDRRGST